MRENQGKDEEGTKIVVSDGKKHLQSAQRTYAVKREVILTGEEITKILKGEDTTPACVANPAPGKNPPEPRGTTKEGRTASKKEAGGSNQITGESESFLSGAHTTLFRRTICKQKHCSKERGRDQTAVKSSCHLRWYNRGKGSLRFQKGGIIRLRTKLSAPRAKAKRTEKEERKGEIVSEIIGRNGARTRRVDDQEPTMIYLHYLSWGCASRGRTIEGVKRA